MPGGGLLVDDEIVFDDRALRANQFESKSHAAVLIDADVSAENARQLRMLEHRRDKARAAVVDQQIVFEYPTGPKLQADRRGARDDAAAHQCRAGMLRQIEVVTERVLAAGFGSEGVVPAVVVEDALLDGEGGAG